MSEDKPGDKPDDVKDSVKRDDYNKVVESHNSIKAEKEKIEKELQEMKENIEKKSVEDTEKKAWEKEKEEMQTQIEELKTVKKGSKAVENTEEAGNEKKMDTQKIKAQIDEAIPTEGIRDPSLMTPLERYAYYKNPATKRASSQLVGRALSLAQSSGISPYAKRSTDDIIVANIKKSLT